MQKTKTQAARSSRRQLILALAIAAFLLLASRGLWSAYSYWGDEMFSVVGSLSPWPSLIPDWVMQGDVHPPLHHIILKAWMGLFGHSEIATRSLSFLWGAAAMLLLAWYTRKRSFRYQLLAVGLLGSSPAFAYYMQETRSYSLVLLLAMAVTICALEARARALQHYPQRQEPAWQYYILCLLLSLTHYFGWIYVFSLTLINLIERLIEPKRWRSLLLILLISIWPAIHILFGSLGGKTGGKFWIESSVPVLSTINHLLMGVFPLVLVSKEPHRLLLLLLTLAFLARFAVPLLTNKGDGARGFPPGSWLPLTETSFLGLGIVLVASILIIVDMKTPMSTARNYIVLLPSVILFLAGIFDSAIAHPQPLSRWVPIALATVLVVAQLHASQNGLREKRWPKVNWKELSEVVKKTKICEEGCYSDRANTYFSYYFQPRDLTPFPVAALSDDTSMESFAREARAKDRSFLLLDRKLRAADGTLRRSLQPSHVCLEPRQLNPGPLLLVPARAAPALEQQGLVPCREG